MTRAFMEVYCNEEIETLDDTVAGRYRLLLDGTGRPYDLERVDMGDDLLRDDDELLKYAKKKGIVR